MLFNSILQERINTDKKDGKEYTILNEKGPVVIFHIENCKDYIKDEYHINDLFSKYKETVVDVEEINKMSPYPDDHIYNANLYVNKYNLDLVTLEYTKKFEIKRLYYGHTLNFTYLGKYAIYHKIDIPFCNIFRINTDQYYKMDDKDNIGLCHFLSTFCAHYAELDIPKNYDKDYIEIKIKATVLNYKILKELNRYKTIYTNKYKYSGGSCDVL